MIRSIYEGLKRPESLYKYRDWNNSFHRRMLTHREIYLPSPTEFNDPFDSHIPVRYDLLTYEECFNMNYDLISLLLKKDGFSENEIKEKAKELTDSKKFAHPETVKKEDVTIWNKRIGLMSLSEIDDNILLWSHYGCNHQGFTIGLKTESLVYSDNFDYLEPIYYSKEYPIIKGTEDTTLRFYKRFFSKSELWSYEKEWRLTKNHIENRKIRLPEDAISKIILGCRISEKNANEIRRIRDRKYTNIQIFKTAVNDSNFALDLISID